MHAKKKNVEVAVGVEEVPTPNSSKSSSKKRDKGNRARLLCMLALTFGYFLVEIVVGYMTNSVALVADSFHMLSDVISLIIAYFAVRMSSKKSAQNTFGWARAEVLGALVNAVFLVALCMTIVTDSIQRFIDIQDIKDPKLVLIVGTVGLVINLIGLVIFHEHGHMHGHSHGQGHGHSHGQGHGHSHNKKGESHHGHSHSHNNLTLSPLDYEEKKKSVDLVHWTVLPPQDSQGTNANSASSEDVSMKKTASGTQMNMHGVWLHVLADALGSVIVIISALIIWLTEWEYRMYIDPLLSLIMVSIIMCSVWPLLVESAMVLLQTVPTHIQIDELKNKLLTKIRGVQEVHEFHIWQLSGNRIIASAHILCNSQHEFMRIGEDVKEFFHNEGIHSTTIQLECPNNNVQNISQPSDGSDSENGDTDSDTRSDCFLTCPYDDEDAECVSNSCCGVPKKRSPAVISACGGGANSTIISSIEHSECSSHSHNNSAYVSDSTENENVQKSRRKNSS